LASKMLRMSGDNDSKHDESRSGPEKMKVSRQGEASRSLAVGEAKAAITSPIRVANPEMVRIINSLESVDIFLREVDNRFVGRNAALGDRLGDDGDAGFVRLERDEDRRRRDLVLVRDLFHDGVVVQWAVVRPLR
jgi:hypothetical protein